MKRFGKLVKKTHCLFARKEGVWGALPFSEKLSFTENMKKRVLPYFTLFVRGSEVERLDGFVVEVKERCEKLEELGKLLYRVMRELSRYEEGSMESILWRDVSSKLWSFQFGGVKLFVSSFGECYSSKHSRFGFGITKKRSYFLFQPESSFSRNSIPTHSNPNSIRHKIRLNFTKHGRPYLVSPINAREFLKGIPSTNIANCSTRECGNKERANGEDEEKEEFFDWWKLEKGKFQDQDYFLPQQENNLKGEKEETEKEGKW